MSTSEHPKCPVTVDALVDYLDEVFPEVVVDPAMPAPLVYHKGGARGVVLHLRQLQKWRDEDQFQ